MKEKKTEQAYEMIFCVVNAGFSETVMDAAKEAGATGGTIIRARGTANKDAEELFQLTVVVHSDKEIVMIVVPRKIKDDVLAAVYRVITSSEMRGIAFSLPVNRALGLNGE